MVGLAAGGSLSGANEHSADYAMPDLSSTFVPGAMSMSTGAVSHVPVNRKGRQNAPSSPRSAAAVPSSVGSAVQVAEPGSLSSMIGAMSSARDLTDVLLDTLGDGPTGQAASRPASSAADGVTPYELKRRKEDTT